MIICKLRTWSRSEKIGVKFQARVSKELFGLIEDIELMELPLQGRKFTWNNAVSAAKLDRFLFYNRLGLNVVYPCCGDSPFLDMVQTMFLCCWSVRLNCSKGFSSLKDHGFNKKTLFRGWSFGGMHSC